LREDEPVGVEVRPAAPADLVTMQQVGARAGRRFAAVDDPVVAACADHPPLALDRLAACQAAGRAWVAVAGPDLAGFVVADLVDGSDHIEEVAVDPEHGRRGIGRALVATVVDHAIRHGLPAVTLTTFRGVPWNEPWYRGLGFRVLAEDEIGQQLRALREEEALVGLLPDNRVCMRLDVG
jgi:ribosomal protein S18 acetylase RimI-like enzyme